MSKKKSENGGSDPSPEAYTPTEILEQVALGNMSPLDAGITGPIPIIGESQPDPANLRVLPKGPTPRKFGEQMEFQASVVPLTIRAEWERQDAKIIPFDTEAWIEQHKNEYRVQAMLACGNGVLRLDETYSDGVLGFCDIMRKAAQMLEEAYKKDNESVSTQLPK
jgi:hypothetical protein